MKCQPFVSVLRSWRKFRGSEDRKIGPAMIGRSIGIGMIGSDISCINTNSTQISIARTTVTACHRSQQCWFQFRKTTKCFERDKVYINVNYRRQTSINPENQRTNTEIVAILIWFLGTCALPFCFAGPVQLVRCDVCSTRVLTVKLCTANLSPLTWYCGTLICCALALPVLNMRHSECTSCIGPAKQNGSAQVPKNQMSIATISVLVLWFSGLIDVNQSEFCMHLFC